VAFWRGAAHGMSRNKYMGVVPAMPALTLCQTFSTVRIDEATCPYPCRAVHLLVVCNRRLAARVEGAKRH
jgi:hypothetical protein